MVNLSQMNFCFMTSFISKNKTKVIYNKKNNKRNINNKNMKIFNNYFFNIIKKNINIYLFIKKYLDKNIKGNILIQIIFNCLDKIDNKPIRNNKYLLFIFLQFSK